MPVKKQNIVRRIINRSKMELELHRFRKAQYKRYIDFGYTTVQAKGIAAADVRRRRRFMRN